MRSLASFKDRVEQRLADHFDNANYRAGKTRLAIIESEIARSCRLSQATMASWTLGIMRTREADRSA